ncbi:MAG: tRNA (adenosine(37)-N6)-dimethylallyltransferase MiaA [Verrucomicrobia bacterium]|nr:tRNA (adenosine(37)-N6)-dimethylallyltransferase MiaA [Verrucomicrobiota bacterium]
MAALHVSTQGKEPRAYILVGPTATGKSDVAHAIARDLGLRILSADSMLVYRAMDIGTAKPTSAMRAEVEYLGLDCVDHATPFSVAAWLTHIREQISRLRWTYPLLVVGGTGLYIRALMQGLRPGGAVDPRQREDLQRLADQKGVEALAEKLHALDPDAFVQLADKHNVRRLIRAIERASAGASAAVAETWTGDLDTIVGLRYPAPVLHSRIESRVRAMYRNGLLTEAQALQAGNQVLSETASAAIGYAEALAHLNGTCAVEDALTRTVIRTRQLAKRQRTWFNHQARVDWVDGDSSMTTAALATAVVGRWERHGASRLRGLE